MLDTLRATHSSLLDTLNSLPPFPSAYHSQVASPSVGFNPSFSFGGTASGATTPLSPNVPPPTQYASRSAQGFYPGHRGTPSRASSRASFSSFFSADEGDGWDDASSSIIEGEFVLDDEEDEVAEGDESDNEEETDERGRPAQDGGETARALPAQAQSEAGLTTRRRRSTIAEEEEEEEEGFDRGEETDEEVMAEEEKKNQVGRKRSQTTTSNYDQKVNRRTSLPSQSGPEEGLLGLAKQVIGKVRKRGSHSDSNGLLD